MKKKNNFILYKLAALIFCMLILNATRVNRVNAQYPFAYYVPPSNPGVIPFYQPIIYPNNNQIDLFNIIRSGIQQAINLSPQRQISYQTNAGNYFPYQTSQAVSSYSYPASNINTAQGPIYQPVTASSYSSLPGLYNPVLNYNAINPDPFYNPVYNQALLNQKLPGIFDQRYYTSPAYNQGELVQIYYPGAPLSGAATYQPYISNSNYYAAGINGFSNGIRISTIPGAELVLANPDYGMYCWDPIKWLEGGYLVGIWCENIPVRAQSLDKRGRLLDDAPTFTVEPTGQTGIMSVLDSPTSLYRALIKASGPADYFVTVVVDAASTIAVAKRRNATCDSCHPKPPGHIGISLAWGNCHECHNLGDVLHRHAYKAGIAVDNCYKCHPSGCLSGAHGQLGIWCTPCHGTLEDALYGKMRISGQLGKPQCADCHDPLHSEPGTALFVDSVGHGNIWCINCHGATHVEVAQPVGLNNCKICHTVQAKIPWMGPNCALCHGSSVSPHLVTD